MYGAARLTPNLSRAACSHQSSGVLARTPNPPRETRTLMVAFTRPLMRIGLES